MLFLSLVCLVLLGDAAFGVSNDDLRELFENIHSETVLPSLKIATDERGQGPSLEDLRELFEKGHQEPGATNDEDDEKKNGPKPAPGPKPGPKKKPKKPKKSSDTETTRKTSGASEDSKSKEISLTVRERRRLNRQDRIEDIEKNVNS